MHASGNIFIYRENK